MAFSNGQFIYFHVRKLTVFCIDSGQTAVINMDQVCPKEMPQLMQERSQAVRCCLVDATHVTYARNRILMTLLIAIGWFWPVE